MVKIETLYNENKEPLTTKEGKELLKYTFELGDKFIPVKNVMFNKKNSKFGSKVLLVNLKDKNNKQFNEIFIDLTPTQADFIQKQLDNGVLINQELFTTYEYENDFGVQVGIGLKKQDIKPKSFEDFED